MKCEGLLSQVR